MKLYDAGLITNDEKGLNLATVIAKCGFSVSVFVTGFDTLTAAEQKEIIDTASLHEINVVPDLESFMVSLESPRKIFVFSLSPEFNQRYLDGILDALDEGDAVSNLCDMNYIEAGRIVEEQKKNGIFYLPTGMPRGEISLEEGISIMPGGYYEGYELMRPVFSEIAARDEEGFVCCPYIGPAGSGQFVKMVINGLEYSLLEIDAEMVSLIKKFLSDDPDDIVEYLCDLNSSESESFFLDMFTDIYSRYDEETGLPITTVASDLVAYGRGVVWLCNEATKLGMPLSVVNASLELRFLSALKNERIASSKMIGDLETEKIPEAKRRLFLDRLRNSAYLAGICALAQCFGLLRSASEKYNWEIDLLAVSRTMQVNSYTRSRCLNRVIEAFDRNEKLVNLFTDPYFRKCVSAYSGNLRAILKLGITAGIPLPAMSAALQYVDCYKSSDLGSGIIQLSRDYINGSGYQRNDRQGVFQANWSDHERMLKQKLYGK